MEAKINTINENIVIGEREDVWITEIKFYGNNDNDEVKTLYFTGLMFKEDDEGEDERERVTIEVTLAQPIPFKQAKEMSPSELYALEWESWRSYKQAQGEDG